MWSKDELRWQLAIAVAAINELTATRYSATCITATMAAMPSRSGLWSLPLNIQGQTSLAGKNYCGADV